MARHWEEVAVVVKERNTILDAPSSNDKVDGLADSDAEPAQGSEIFRRQHSNGITGHRNDLEAAKQRFYLSSRPFAIQALQDLA
jgi:hypothetical protein